MKSSQSSTFFKVFFYHLNETIKKLVLKRIIHSIGRINVSSQWRLTVEWENNHQQSGDENKWSSLLFNSNNLILFIKIYINILTKTNQDRYISTIRLFRFLLCRLFSFISFLVLILHSPKPPSPPPWSWCCCLH